MGVALLFCDTLNALDLGEERGNANAHSPHFLIGDVKDMPRETILIGCKLPHGLLLHDPRDRENTLPVALLGAKDEKEKGSGYGLTAVDAEFWTIWKAAYMDYTPP